MPPSIVLTVALNADDGMIGWGGGDTFSTADSAYMGKNSSADWQACWAVFKGIQIPQGYTIASAYLTCVSGTSDSSTTCKVKVRSSNQDTVVVPTSHAEVDAITKTTAVVSGITLPAWTAATTYAVGGDIKTVIQETINRAGWVAGNNLMIYVEDDGSSNYASRRAAQKGWTLTITLAGGAFPQVYVS
jgi:hypothetical protein